MKPGLHEFDEARREGGKSAAVSGPSDRSRPQTYSSTSRIDAVSG